VERSARKEVRKVMRGFGVTAARRATTTDDTEEVFLLSPPDLFAVDVNALTRALMDVLPGTKVWVVQDTVRWVSEPI
jgi:hypothetical protein